MRHAGRWPGWVARTRPKHGRGLGRPVQHTGVLVRRLDRSSSPAAFFAPRPLRAGQAAAAAPAAGVATVLLPRYASPVAIMAHTMRAIVWARATAPRSAPPIARCGRVARAIPCAACAPARPAAKPRQFCSPAWQGGSPPLPPAPATAAAGRAGEEAAHFAGLGPEQRGQGGRVVAVPGQGRLEFVDGLRHSTCPTISTDTRFSPSRNACPNAKVGCISICTAVRSPSTNTSIKSASKASQGLISLVGAGLQQPGDELAAVFLQRFMASRRSAYR